MNDDCRMTPADPGHNKARQDNHIWIALKTWDTFDLYHAFDNFSHRSFQKVYSINECDMRFAGYDMRQ